MYKVTLGHFQLTPTKALGSPRCIFCEYSERVSQKPKNSSFLMLYSSFSFLPILMNLFLIKKQDTWSFIDTKSVE